MISSTISGGPTPYVVRDIDAGVWLPDLVHSQSLRAVAQRWSACLVCTRPWIPIQLFEKQEKIHTVSSTAGRTLGQRG